MPATAGRFVACRMTDRPAYPRRRHGCHPIGRVPKTRGRDRARHVSTDCRLGRDATPSRAASSMEGRPTGSAPRRSVSAKVTDHPRHAEYKRKGHDALNDQGPAVAHADECQDACRDCPPKRDAYEQCKAPPDGRRARDGHRPACPWQARRRRASPASARARSRVVPFALRASTASRRFPLAHHASLPEHATTATATATATERLRHCLRHEVPASYRRARKRGEKSVEQPARAHAYRVPAGNVAVAAADKGHDRHLTRPA
jgi:hypothetical protein